MAALEIRKQVVLHATRKRVWDAISDPAQFGAWFGVEFAGPFEAGRETIGHIVPTQVDPDVARLQEPHRGTAFRIWIERIEPMRVFAFRWHPYAIDAAINYDAEAMTLVTFELDDHSDGVLLTITETGFDRLPPARREAAWQANMGGWEHQARLIARFLAQCGGEPL